VLQQIVAARSEAPMYWSPEKPTAELDFAIERAGGLVPIEVKAEENLRSKSLRTYIDRFNLSSSRTVGASSRPVSPNGAGR
jgi:hypothetical protein